jgi:hypothetical protein
MVRFLSLLLVLSSLTPSLALGYGEPDEEGLPSPTERSLHFFTDRLRVDPGYTDSLFSGYLPVAPLAYNYELGAAARFYANDMAENGCFPADHSSCDGTPFDTRVSGFYSALPIGENIASGYATPKQTVFEGWLYSDGHRDNMLSDTWNEIGTGFPDTDPSLVWVQDFGGGGLSGQPIATSGTHDPLEPSPQDPLNFFLAVHDPEGQPAQVDLIKEGVCYPMEDDRGSGGLSTFLFEDQSGEARCIPYYFKVSRVNQEEVFYPSTGSLIVPVGAGDCDEWEETRLPVDCESAQGVEPDGPPLGATGQGCGDPSGDPNAAYGAEETTYGSCSQGGREVPGRLLLLLVVLLPSFLRRRRL